MLEPVGPESIDVVVVVNDEIPMYTHSVSLPKVLFTLILSSLPPLPATRLGFRNNLLVSSSHLLSLFGDCFHLRVPGY
jgi:hypothetical protein